MFTADLSTVSNRIILTRYLIFSEGKTNTINVRFGSLAKYWLKRQPWGKNLFTFNTKVKVNNISTKLLKFWPSTLRL